MAQLSADIFATSGKTMRVEEALALVKERLPMVRETESVPLFAADGRILAETVTAPVDLPLFDNSAVDGYAVAHADLNAGAATILPVEGRIAAGHGGGALHLPGSASRIFTGAPMPLGADSVFMQEDVSVAEDGRVTLPDGLAPGANVRPRGEDIAEGAVAIAEGKPVDPRDIALAAALGFSHLTVRRRLNVAVFSTGDEILEPGTILSPAALYDSNRYSLMALLSRAGCNVTDLGILADSPDLIARRLRAAAPGHDLIVTSGGVSAGEEDHLRAVIAENGSLVFWRLAIKPGKPVALGVIGGTPLVGLPGNPVAVFVTWAHVLWPILKVLQGAEIRPLPAAMVPAAFSFRKKAGRREYLRVGLEAGPDGLPVLVLRSGQGSGLVTSLTRTDGFAVIPEESTGIVPGQLLAFHDYRLVL